MVRRGFVDLPMGQLHYRTDGEGEPLFMMHQSPSSSLTFAEVLPILGKQYRAIAWDCPGLGDSFRVTEQHEIPWYADRVIEALDALKIKKTNLLGHHGGASIALEVAAAHPERVSKLILSELCFISDQERAKRQKWIANPWREPVADGSHLCKAWQKLREAEVGFPGPNLELASREAVEWTRTISHYYHFHVSIYTYDPGARLPKVKCPTLCISGEKDMNYNQTIEASKLIKNSTFASIKGYGPMYHWLAPKEFSQKVLDFLKS